MLEKFVFSSSCYSTTLHCNWNINALRHGLCRLRAASYLGVPHPLPLVIPFPRCNRCRCKQCQSSRPLHQTWNLSLQCRVYYRLFFFFFTKMTNSKQVNAFLNTTKIQMQYVTKIFLLYTILNFKILFKFFCC